MKSKNRKPQRESMLWKEAQGAQDMRRKWTAEGISRDGWCLHGVRAYIPFIYTVGNYQIDLPELLVMGSDRADPILNAVCKFMREINRPFDDGELLEFGDICILKSLNVGDEAKKEYTDYIGDYYGIKDYAVQQILVPDPSGRYPDDPGCETPYCLVPVLARHH